MFVIFVWARPNGLLGVFWDNGWIPHKRFGESAIHLNWIDRPQTPLDSINILPILFESPHEEILSNVSNHCNNSQQILLKSRRLWRLIYQFNSHSALLLMDFFVCILQYFCVRFSQNIKTCYSYGTNNVVHWLRYLIFSDAMILMSSDCLRHCC